MWISLGNEKEKREVKKIQKPKTRKKENSLNK